MDRISHSSTTQLGNSINSIQSPLLDSSMNKLDSNAKDRIIIHACTKVQEFQNQNSLIQRDTMEAFKTEIKNCFNQLNEEKGYFTLGHTRSTVYLAASIYYLYGGGIANNIHKVYDFINENFGTNLGSNIWFTCKNTQYLNEISDAIAQSHDKNNNQASLLPKETIITSSGGEVHNLQNIINALPIIELISIDIHQLVSQMKIINNQILLNDNLSKQINQLSNKTKYPTEQIWYEVVRQLLLKNFHVANDDFQLYISCSTNNQELCEICTAIANTQAKIAYLEINGDNLSVSYYASHDGLIPPTQDQLQNALIQLKEACPSLSEIVFSGTKQIVFERDIIVPDVIVSGYDQESIKLGTFRQVLRVTDPRVTFTKPEHYTDKEEWRDAVRKAGGDMDKFDAIDRGCRFSQILACYPRSYNDPGWTSHLLIP